MARGHCDDCGRRGDDCREAGCGWPGGVGDDGRRVGVMLVGNRGAMQEQGHEGEKKKKKKSARVRARNRKINEERERKL